MSTISHSFLKHELEKRYSKKGIKENTVEKSDAVAFLAKLIRNGKTDEASRKKANAESVAFINSYLAEDN